VIRGCSALAALCALAVFPAAVQKRVVVRGAGSESCAQYVQAYDQYRTLVASETTASQAITNYLQYEARIQGYLFGVDSWNRAEIRAFDRAGMQIWVYGYCQKHSLQLIADAALAFYRELGGPSPTVAYPDRDRERQVARRPPAFAPERPGSTQERTRFRGRGAGGHSRAFSLG
jgi:hypothetical protein